MVKQHLDHDLLEEVKFVSPFFSHEPIFHPCETERPSLPPLELKPCPSGLTFHEESLEEENFCAINSPDTLDNEYSTNEHENFSFELPQDSCSHLESPESVSLSIACFYNDLNNFSILIYQNFRRLVVDTFVYHKHCKFRECTVALTLQLEQ